MTLAQALNEHKFHETVIIKGNRNVIPLPSDYTKEVVVYLLVGDTYAIEIKED